MASLLSRSWTGFRLQGWPRAGPKGVLPCPAAWGVRGPLAGPRPQRPRPALPAHPPRLAALGAAHVWPTFRSAAELRTPTHLGGLQPAELSSETATDGAGSAAYVFPLNCATQVSAPPLRLLPGAGGGRGCSEPSWACFGGAQPEPGEGSALEIAELLMRQPGGGGGSGGGTGGKPKAAPDRRAKRPGGVRVEGRWPHVRRARQPKSGDALGETSRTRRPGGWGGQARGSWQRDKAGGERQAGSATDPETRAAADAGPTRRRVLPGPAGHTRASAPRDPSASPWGLLPQLVSVGPGPAWHGRPADGGVPWVILTDRDPSGLSPSWNLGQR